MEITTHTQTNRIGKRGAWVVPARLRHLYGLEEGTLVIAEPRPDGILLKPAVATPVGNTNIWGEWFELMGTINATAEEVAEAKSDGRR